MPSFISHMNMAKDVYKKLDKSVNKDYMITFSLGGDLTKYSKCRYNTHHKDKDRFIYEMADYIKDNKLTDDKELMGVLYGHICHYVMDEIINPLVRKIGNDKHGHTMVEEEYDSYLIRISKKNYLRNNRLNGKVNKKVKKVLNKVYLDVYDTNNIAFYYKFNLLLYRILRRLYLLFNIDKISGLDKYKIGKKDLYNNKHLVKYKDYIGYECNDSLDELYLDSINIALSI